MVGNDFVRNLFIFLKEYFFIETLRKYPAIPSLNRQCTEDYRIPDTDVVLERGIKVLVSIMGLHHDPEYFPNPEKFIPERFSDENKEYIQPYTYLPFGDGPRNCIGGYSVDKITLCVRVIHQIALDFI